jgi:glutamine synthetase
MTLDELRADVSAGRTDTVLLVVCDMRGRLRGKRVTARHFLDVVVEQGAAADHDLLGVDVDMGTDGDGPASREQVPGDVEIRPDLTTLRRVPWHEGTALCLGDVARGDRAPVAASPRHVLRRQLERFTARGWEALVGTELEFLVFTGTYEQAWDAGYRDLTPANRYGIDHSMLGTARVEPLIRRIRNAMTDAEMGVEGSGGRRTRGQHEITFRYAHALRTADDHVISKNGAKEIAAQEGVAITYMAKYDEREGNACHIHLSLRDRDGAALFATDDQTLLERFIAGQLATLRELTLLLAPNVNSYKRFTVGSAAPTAIAWGLDNRTCALRVVGHGPDRRVECRLPGADVNPYLAIAALIAGGLHGIDHELPLEEPYAGNAFLSDKPRVPTTLREAAELFGASPVARDAFGEDVVDLYLEHARAELDAFDAAVTDWERFRGFERL